VNSVADYTSQISIVAHPIHTNEVRFNVHASAIYDRINTWSAHPARYASNKGNPNSRLTQRLRDARFHALDLGRSETGEGALVLGATEARADGALEVGNGRSDGGSALTTGLGWLRRCHD
jgi:hypothetical protein